MICGEFIDINEIITLECDHKGWFLIINIF